MVNEEVEKFEELLKNKCIGDAGDWIKYTHNVLYYISNAGKNQTADGMVNPEQYRELVGKISTTLQINFS